MAYIYRHIRLDKNEPFYIGASLCNDEYKRAYEKQKNRRCSEWYDIVSLTDYEVDILVDDISDDEAYKKEAEFILLYGRIDIKTGCLVNKTDGGKGWSLPY